MRVFELLRKKNAMANSRAGLAMIAGNGKVFFFLLHLLIRHVSVVLSSKGALIENYFRQRCR